MSTSGKPLSGAELDMWQADAQGHYSNVHPGTPDWNLRGRFRTEPDGSFEVRTIVPPPYEIPKHGPAGAVLKALGRHCFRPAHLHLKVRHLQYEELTSQLYFDGGQYLEIDVANAVRDDLTIRLNRREVADGPFRTCFEASCDFMLMPRHRAPRNDHRGES